MKKVSIIRERGQLTIPDSIRKAAPWASTYSAVTVSLEKPNEIVIKPNEPKISHDKLWEMVEKSRAIKGKGKSSALEFIQKDRLSH